MSRFFTWLFQRILPWVVLAHAALFIVFWLTNRLFYTSTNDFLANMLGSRLDYVSILLWVAAFISVWSLARGLLGILGKTHRLSKLTGWLYGVTSLVYILFFYGSFGMLFSESPVQVVRIGQLLGYYRLSLDAAVLLGLVLLAGLLLRSAFSKGRVAAGWRYGLLVIALLVFAGLWSLAFAFPPANVTTGNLPARPLLIAHRGASMLAPENTIAAASLASSLGVYGIETDVQVSQDGQLFLMHDDSLDRTTDAAALFPGRHDDPAANFTWAELSQLDAGTWFVQQDPYGAIKRGLVTPQQVAEYRHQEVPLLDDWLDIVQADGIRFIFDLKAPPPGHPHAGSFFEQALEQIHAAGVDPQIWFLVSPAELATLQSQAPSMVAAYGADYQHLPSAGELLSHGYQLVNVEYGISPAMIKNYQYAGLWVNVYTVDEPWLFSRLWLLGVNSVTTSNAGVLAALERPVFSLDYHRYLVVWGLVGLAGVCLILGLVLPMAKEHQ